MGLFWSSDTESDSKVDGGVNNSVNNIVTLGGPISLTDEILIFLGGIFFIKLFEFGYMCYKIWAAKVKKRTEEKFVLANMQKGNSPV